MIAKYVLLRIKEKVVNNVWIIPFYIIINFVKVVVQIIPLQIKIKMNVFNAKVNVNNV